MLLFYTFVFNIVLKLDRFSWCFASRLGSHATNACSKEKMQDDALSYAHSLDTGRLKSVEGDDIPSFPCLPHPRKIE